jgi:hypothetical protein
MVDGDAGRHREADRAGMAALGQTFHEECHIRRRDAEFVFESAAAPQRRRLHVFRHADAPALEPGWAVDACILTHQDSGVVEAPRREHRHADEPFIAAGANHHQLRHRHFGNVELGEAELTPEHFRWAENGNDEINAGHRDAPVDDRPGTRIVGNGETEFQIGHVSSPFCRAMIAENPPAQASPFSVSFRRRRPLARPGCASARRRRRNAIAWAQVRCAKRPRWEDDWW